MLDTVFVPKWRHLRAPTQGCLDDTWSVVIAVAGRGWGWIRYCFGEQLARRMLADAGFTDLDGP